jgi:DNA invertase Pin-like site-specific DNA recombinase
MGHLLGYARVSTSDQNPRLQTDELTAAGCWKVYVDQASGSLDRRPNLDEVLAQLRPGDTLVVWRLDRLGRSLRHLIDTVRALEQAGVGFRSLRENIDTTTPGGRLVFHIFGALAQFEREIIRERTVAGLAAARARGRTGGRPSVMTPDKVKAARRMYDDREHTVEQIAAILGVGRTSIYRALQKLPEPASSPIATAGRRVRRPATAPGGHEDAGQPGRQQAREQRRRQGPAVGPDVTALVEDNRSHPERRQPRPRRPAARPG